MKKTLLLLLCNVIWGQVSILNALDKNTISNNTTWNKFSFKNDGEFTIYSTQDAYVRNGCWGRHKNYGSLDHMAVKNDPSANYQRKSFIQFDVSSISQLRTGEKVVLELTPTKGGLIGDDIRYYHVSNDNWSERTVKWKTAPSFGTEFKDQKLYAGTNRIDVTSFVKSAIADGKLTIGIQRKERAGSVHGGDFATKEHADESMRPKLVVIKDTDNFVDNSDNRSGEPMYSTQDAYVRSGCWGRHKNYGSLDHMANKHDGHFNYKRKSLVQFDVSGISKLAAGEKVILELTQTSDLSGDAVSFYNVSNDNWDERTVKWNNAPAFGNESIVQKLETGTNRIDVTSFVKSAIADGKLTIGIYLKNKGASFVNFATKECTDKSKHPKLVITKDTDNFVDNSDTEIMVSEIEEDEIEEDEIEEGEMEEGEMEESKVELFQIYPNPSNGLLNVVIPNMDKSYTYTIGDMHGKRYVLGQRLSNDNNRIDVSQFKSGMYFISIMEQNGKMHVLPFVKQ